MLTGLVNMERWLDQFYFFFLRKVQQSYNRLLFRNAAGELIDRCNAVQIHPTIGKAVRATYKIASASNQPANRRTVTGRGVPSPRYTAGAVYVYSPPAMAGGMHAVRSQRTARARPKLQIKTEPMYGWTSSMVRAPSSAALSHLQSRRLPP